MVENIENVYIPEMADIIWILSTIHKENKQEKSYPVEVRCEILDKDSAILSDQLTSVDYKARKATFITQCDESVFHHLKAKIALLFELNY